MPRRERPIRDVLSRGELDELERVMPHERDKLIIRIFADCGLRLEELTRLDAGDLICGGRQAHLRVHGKRDRIRDVPLPPNLVRRVERLIASRPVGRTSDAIFLVASTERARRLRRADHGRCLPGGQGGRGAREDFQAGFPTPALPAFSVCLAELSSTESKKHVQCQTRFDTNVAAAAVTVALTSLRRCASRPR